MNGVNIIRLARTSKTVVALRPKFQCSTRSLFFTPRSPPPINRSYSTTPNFTASDTKPSDVSANSSLPLTPYEIALAGSVSQSEQNAPLKTSVSDSSPTSTPPTNGDSIQHEKQNTQNNQNTSTQQNNNQRNNNQNNTQNNQRQQNRPNNTNQQNFNNQANDVNQLSRKQKKQNRSRNRAIRHQQEKQQNQFQQNQTQQNQPNQNFTQTQEMPQNTPEQPTNLHDTPPSPQNDSNTPPPTFTSTDQPFYSFPPNYIQSPISVQTNAPPNTPYIIIPIPATHASSQFTVLSPTPNTWVVSFDSPNFYGQPGQPLPPPPPPGYFEIPPPLYVLIYFIL